MQKDRRRKVRSEKYIVSLCYSIVGTDAEKMRDRGWEGSNERGVEGGRGADG